MLLAVTMEASAAKEEMALVEMVATAALLMGAMEVIVDLIVQPKETVKAFWLLFHFS